MVAKKETAVAASQPVAKNAAPKAEASESPRTEFSPTASRSPVSDDTPQKAGQRGPKSALEGGEGSIEQRIGETGEMEMSVQVHSDEAIGGLKKGLQVLYVTAKSGDEAGLKVREAHKANYGLSIRGITPASDPDANSLGGERDASIMAGNALNEGHIVNSLGTEANAKATSGLAKADIQDMGE